MSAPLLVRKISTDPNSASADAFGRHRVSATGQRLDIEFIYDKMVDFVDEVTNNGTVTFNANSRDLDLSLADANAGSYALVSTHPVPYTPGNSQNEDITGVLDLAGIGGGVAQTFIRTTVSGTTVEHTTDQSAWTSKSSGVDWSDSHIFFIDLQSLKVGRIRFALVSDGVTSFVDEIVNDNIRNTGYWQLAMLPAFWKIYNDATYTYMEMGYGDDKNAVGFRYRVAANANATMKAICATVKSEGGTPLLDLPGIPRSASNEVTPVAVSTTLVPVISIRPKATFLTLPNLGLVLPKSYSVKPSNPILLKVISGGTLTSPSWVDVDATHSCVEYDVSATGITGGRVIGIDYFSTTANNRPTSAQGLLGKSPMWNRLGTETGVLSICAVRTGASNSDTLAAINWEEIR